MLLLSIGLSSSCLQAAGARVGRVVERGTEAVGGRGGKAVPHFAYPAFIPYPLRVSISFLEFFFTTKIFYKF
jgi:hypothetical protein